jgi:hypothetical protein
MAVDLGFPATRVVDAVLARGQGNKPPIARCG